MFEAFRRAKGDKPEEQKPAAQGKPQQAKPVAAKPVLPIATPTKPAEFKPAAPKAAEVKPAAPAPVLPKPAEVKPAAPQATEAKSAPVVAAAPTPVVAPARPVIGGAVKPAAAVAGGAASRPTAASGSTASELKKLEKDDVHVVALGGKPEVIFGLSYHALIVGIIAVVVAGVLVFLVALWLGHRGKPADTAKKPPAGKLDVVSGKESKTGETPAPVATDVYYRVQIMTVTNTPDRLRALDEDLAFLKTMHVDNLVKQTNRKGDRVSLFAGAYTREQKADAEALASRVKLMLFHNRKEFKDAQVVTVQ
jgi:hypothetical protein